MFDYDDFRLEDGSAAFTVSAAGALGATAQIVNLGEGLVRADWLVDVSAIEIASNNEYYDLFLQGSTSSSFAGTYTNLAELKLGANEVLTGDQDSAVGRYRVPFSNETPDGTIQDEFVRTLARVAISLARDGVRCPFTLRASGSADSQIKRSAFPARATRLSFKSVSPE